MAGKASSKKKSSGGGRPRNSEPQVQVFKQFTGMNIQENQADFDPSGISHDQADLQMTYMEIQNNVAVTSMKTLETVNKTVEKFLVPPTGTEFTGPIVNIGAYIYAATSNADTSEYAIYKTNVLDPTNWTKIEVKNAAPKLGTLPDKTEWTWIGLVGGYIVALTRSNNIFISEYKENESIKELSFYPKIASPTENKLTIYGDPWEYGRQYALYPRGFLRIKEVASAEEAPPADMQYRI